MCVCLLERIQIFHKDWTTIMDRDRQTLWQANHEWYVRGLNRFRYLGAMHKLCSRDSVHDLRGNLSLVHACVAIVVAWTDTRQSQILLLFMVCVP